MSNNNSPDNPVGNVKCTVAGEEPYISNQPPITILRCAKEYTLMDIRDRSQELREGPGALNEP